MIVEILINCKYRVRASVYPNNRIILAEHGVRQVAFPYDYSTTMKFINLSFNGFICNLGGKDE